MAALYEPPGLLPCHGLDPPAVRSPVGRDYKDAHLLADQDSQHSPSRVGAATESTEKAGHPVAASLLQHRLT
jgi:hypothetical protein